MQDKLTTLKARLAEIDDVDNAAAILEWDQLVMMPPAGGEGRSYKYATLQKLAHELYITPEMGRLIEDLSANVHQHGRKYLPADLMVRVTGRPLTAKPYLACLKRKYGELYGL